MKPTLQEAFVVITELVATHTIKKHTSTSAQKRHDAWIKASDFLKRAAMTETDAEIARAELMAMPSVRHVSAAAVEVHRCLAGFGKVCAIETLTMRQLELIAHAALFTKEPESPFAKALS